MWFPWSAATGITIDDLVIESFFVAFLSLPKICQILFLYYTHTQLMFFSKTWVWLTDNQKEYELSHVSMSKTQSAPKDLHSYSFDQHIYPSFFHITDAMGNFHIIKVFAYGTSSGFVLPWSCGPVASLWWTTFADLKMNSSLVSRNLLNMMFIQAKEVNINLEVSWMIQKLQIDTNLIHFTNERISY